MKFRVALPVVLLFSASVFVSRAPAEKIFGTVWLEKYVPAEPVTEEQEAWAATAKEAKCYVCHVKGKSKKYCNTYGDVLSQWLKSDDYERERIEAAEEVAKAEILTALTKAELMKDACDTEFRALFAAYELPSAEPGAASLAQEYAAEDGAEAQAE